jgi:hypothetical protein
MARDRQIVDTRYFQFLKIIKQAGKVPCEDYPDYMFPEDIPDPGKRATVIKLAKALCGQCSIREQCFTYALETGQPAGIWGGTEAHER